MLGSRTLGSFMLGGGHPPAPPAERETLPTFAILGTFSAQADVIERTTSTKVLARITDGKISGRTTLCAVSGHTTSTLLESRSTDVKIGRVTDARLSEGIYG